MKQPLMHTHQFRTTAFSPHGDVALWYENHIAYFEAIGPFNVERVESLAVLQAEFIRQINPQGPWASIAVFKVSAVMSPDCLTRYEDLTSDHQRIGFAPVATAFVMAPEVDGHSLMAPLFARVFERIGRPFMVVSNVDDARSWVLGRVDPALASPASIDTNI